MMSGIPAQETKGGQEREGLSRVDGQESLFKRRGGGEISWVELEVAC